ncbi:MAG: DUF1003 domain-containing protein [Dehalococcoidia bacterium]
MSHLRFRAPSAHITSPFGRDRFGRLAEGFARAFGSPYFLVGQTVVVVVWVVLNVAHITTFDLYPFILLNLAFSFQAAYAAPLILLAETREADRDHAHADADARHREEISRVTLDLLQRNTDLTERVNELSERIHALTAELHDRFLPPDPSAPPS